MNKKVLGRGLSALIPNAASPREMTDPSRGGGAAVTPITQAVPREFLRAAIEDVHPSSDQPRRIFDPEALETLIESVRRDGVLQPLLVRQRSANEGGGFAIIAGERRWRAAQRAGLQEVPVVVREFTPRAAFEVALVENLQREDLNPMEEAEAYERLLSDHGMTQEQLAERVGRDRSTVANALRLLKLPRSIRQLVEQGELSMGQARALLGMEAATDMEAAARRVVAQQLSVRQVESLVRKVRQGSRHAPKTRSSAATRDLSERLQRALGTKVEVIDRGGKGTIEIRWTSLDELDRVIAVLLKN